MFNLRCLAAFFVSVSCLSATFGAETDLPLLFEDDFENGADRWETTDVKAKSWAIVKSEAGKAFRVTGKSDYQPPVRSPHSIALIKHLSVGDFVLTARVQSTNRKAGNHRDMCLFWGYQDPSHFYYVHIATKADPHAGQIFIVNDKPREKITVDGADGAKWGDGWHQVKIARRVADGTIRVYFDDMKKPHLVAKDKSFTWGRVGLGTFDDHGNWDDVKLYGRKAEKE